MKVAVSNTKTYDKEYLDRANEGNQHELVYFESAFFTDKALTLEKGTPDPANQVGTQQIKK